MAIVNQTSNPELFPYYYERKLLSYVKENLLGLKFGQKFTMPMNSGRIAVFTRFEPLPPVTKPITNLPTPQQGANISSQQIQATIQEYGNYIDLDEFTDVTSFTPFMDAAIDLLSYNAQQSLDRIVISELLTGTNVIYASGANSRTELTGNKTLTKTDIRKAVAQLMRKNIPTFPDGYYVCLIHPDKAIDLFPDTELIQLASAKNQAFEKGLIGEFAGVKFYTTTALAPTESIYETLVIGQNAYGLVDVDSKTLQVVYTNLDKLGRVKTVGWKAYFTAKRLYDPAIVRIESN